MQIMPLHFKTLEKYGISEKDLHQACPNINVGAWVLAGFIQEYGPIWRAVGAYGVGNKKTEAAENQRVIYAAKVQRALYRLPQHKNVILPVLKNPRNPEMLVIE
jgi:soluble lytic murein transglycosylase-like protein